jgi:hypothetical protein
MARAAKRKPTKHTTNRTRVRSAKTPSKANPHPQRLIRKTYGVWQQNGWAGP